MVGFVQASVINLIIENNKLIENEACLQLVFDLLVWCTKAVQVVGCPPFGWGYSYFFYFFMVRVRVSVQEMLICPKTQYIRSAALKWRTDPDCPALELPSRIKHVLYKVSI